MGRSSFSIGVDLGGTNLRVAAYTHAAERLDAITLRTRTEAGPQAVLRDISEAVAAVREKISSAGEFAGVGIGSPGPVELPEGRLLDPSNLPGWHGLELKRELETLLRMPVIVESDANAAALAEWHLGSGKTHGADSMAMLTLGTGVGGGLVLAGKIWHGALGMAGEPGHTVVYPGGLLCNCGTRGCLEMYASATAVRRMAGETGLGSDLNAQDVAERARGGDARARRIYAGAGKALGIALAGIVSTLNLPLHAIGGGMANAWDLFAPAMFDSLAQSSQIYRMTQADDAEVFEPRRTNVCRAELGHEAGIIGAALLPYFI